MKAEGNEFAARGGWWVLAQAPVMLGAFAVALVWTWCRIKFLRCAPCVESTIAT